MSRELPALRIGEALGGPEEQRVLVLHLENGDGRIILDRQAGMRIDPRIEFARPVPIGLLHFLIDEEQPFRLRTAAIDLPALGQGEVWIIRRDQNVDAVVFGRLDEAMCSRDDVIPHLHD